MQNRPRRELNRTDLGQGPAVDDDLGLHHMPAQERLGHGVDLVVVSTVGELYTRSPMARSRGAASTRCPWDDTP